MSASAATAAPTKHFWYGYAGSSAVADAVAEQLIQGGSIQQARDLTEQLSSAAAPGTSASINSTLAAQTPGSTGNAVASLLGFRPTPAVSSSDFVGAPRVTPSSVDSATAVVPLSEPAQATHGDTSATGLFTWLLHNNSSTPIFYGNCSPSGCTTGGDFIVNDSANVINSPQVSFSSQVRQGAGQVATFSTGTIAVYRDESGGPDPETYTNNCPSGSGLTKFTCAPFASPSAVTNDWYYFRQDFTACSAVAGCGDIQIQTRRWLVYGSYDYQLIAYNYGG
jgi:hypothetical protein